MAEGESVKISVVMSVYNGEKYLREAIDSILSQTFHDFEFIIIDDGSNDGSAEVVRSYTDSRIRFVQQENRGLAAALNRGVSLAHSDLIARMDQDDISMPDRFEKQYEYLQKHKEVVALGAAAVWIDVNGTYVCDSTVPCTAFEIKNRLPETPFIHPSVMFLKTAFAMVGGYPESFKYAPEDTVFFNRMAKIGAFANIPLPLLKYRLTPQSLSGRNRINRKVMVTLIKKELDKGLSDNDLLLLDALSKKVTSNMKLSAYYSLLSKSYLWENYQPVLARYNAIKAIRSYPWWLDSYILFVLSFFSLKLNLFLCRLNRRLN